MSNRMIDARSIRRKSKVSLAMYISQGLGGAKGLPDEGDFDAQSVNIPTPCQNFYEVTKICNFRVLSDSHSCLEGNQ